VIFADEPTGNLDTKTTFEMMDLITGMAREREQTLIIVTHDIEISNYADQIINMRDGLIESIKNVERKSENEKTETDCDISDSDNNVNADSSVG
jgi:putative ABC transport system ATP-binding protein